MNVNELFSLYEYLDLMLSDTDILINKQGKPVDECYLVNENMVLNLYGKILNGKATRKDFLISAIDDMLYYIEKHQIKGIYSTLLLKYKRIYKKE